METKPCPFCKGEFIDIALDKSFYSETYVSYVFCSCGARGSLVSSEDISSYVMDEVLYDEKDEFISSYLIEKAILKWNERSIDNGKD